MTRPFFIYGLLSPWTKRIRYVGCSVNPKNRRHEGDGNDGALNRWIRRVLRKTKRRPKHVVLAIAYNDRDAGFLEDFYKRRLREAGFRLLNSPRHCPYKNWRNRTPCTKKMRIFDANEQVL